MCVPPPATTPPHARQATDRRASQISPDNLVVRFGESVDGFPLPKGHSHNPALQAPVKE